MTIVQNHGFSLGKKKKLNLCDPVQIFDGYSCCLSTNVWTCDIFKCLQCEEEYLNSEWKIEKIMFS